MGNTPGASTNSPRIAALLERFRMIGETSMRDLPLYNGDLTVEAVGFRCLEGHWIGVLITPWFMNLIRLPDLAAPMDMSGIGRRVKIDLPSGEREMMQGGDQVIGAYESLSLHSPMSTFKTQEAARQEAELRLTSLMGSTEEKARDENGRLSLGTEQQRMSRRAFLRGTPSEA